MGHFKVKAITNVDDLTVGQTICESDFASLTPKGNFFQLEYVEDDYKKEPYKVKPGIWAIHKTSAGLKLQPTSFVSDKILDSFVNTKNITDKIDCFFNKIPVYKELGFEVAKRAALLYGPPGSGKSTAISLIANKYNTDNKTAIVIWHTDKFEPYQVKDFIKSFEYTEVDKLILIAEDIGGIEIENARLKSDSSLLSLLDNQEKTFTCPVFILATTNYPANFMGNLTNRPNRFDDKIEVGFPEPAQRAELLKFFAKTPPSEEALKLMTQDKTKEFSPAHIREIVVRSMIYEKSFESVIKEMCAEIEHYKNAFAKESRMGF
jgi:AAA+ superfamily predicted ATPase